MLMFALSRGGGFPMCLSASLPTGGGPSVSAGKDHTERKQIRTKTIYSGFETPGQHGLTLSMLANIHLESSQISSGNSQFQFEKIKILQK